VDVCSSALLIPAILGCGRTDPPLKPLSEFAEPALIRALRIGQTIITTEFAGVLDEIQVKVKDE
jgi:hypothetical protein